MALCGVCPALKRPHAHGSQELFAGGVFGIYAVLRLGGAVQSGTVWCLPSPPVATRS
jgi:hypothetical protein